MSLCKNTEKEQKIYTNQNNIL